MSVAPTVKLNNGIEMPVLGLGTWQMEEKEGVELIKEAIDCGYRHFDTALLYHSERIIGQAIREKIADGTVARSDLFITTKLWCTYAHPELVVKACKKSLKNLGLDYIDLYLIHWPVAFKATDKIDEPTAQNMLDIETLLNYPEYFPRDSEGFIITSDTDYLDTWKEMEKCVDLGLARSIGVSNFNASQLDRVVTNARILPVTNQVEVNPYLNQKNLIEFCKERKVIVTCYGPLGTAAPPKTPGLPKMTEHPTIKKIAEAKKKSPAQIVLRYLVQLGTVVIPKTSNPKRLPENIDIFDFTLSPEEMTEVDTMNCNDRICIIPDAKLMKHKFYPF
ncbi:hypothetical protein RUM44_000673 [Polyplax serrata]|uniref:NADP-dependent oxidoreductase domain-containing protein n=1 Tax=Polyplax serrata TaxID=468196 RepID=A0ABR1B608_POLSC